jgi:hypothetical protein
VIGLVPRLRCGFVGRMRLLPIDIDGRTASGLSRWLGCGSRSVWLLFQKGGERGKRGGKGCVGVEVSGSFSKKGGKGGKGGERRGKGGKSFLGKRGEKRKKGGKCEKRGAN